MLRTKEIEHRDLWQIQRNGYEVAVILFEDKKVIRLNKVGIKLSRKVEAA